MKGSLIVDFDLNGEFINSFPYYNVTINGVLKYSHTKDAASLYSSLIELGDVVTFEVLNFPNVNNTITFKRIDYTTKDDNDDIGIKENVITEVTITNNYSITFTATTVANAYNFHYVMENFLEPCFNIGTGFDTLGGIYQIIEQPDGKILVVGIFNVYNGIVRNYFIRLNSNGTIDNTFNIGTGFNNDTYSVAIQSDNKILVGGLYTSYSGVSRNHIIRLYTDGSIDNTFNIGSGFNNFVYRIAIQSDNKILVCGGFTSYNGVSRNRIIRLNTDGSIDNTFNIGSGFNDLVYTIAIQSDNKILVGGAFTSYNGINRKFLIRLNTDGSIDNTFNIGTGFDDYIFSIAIQSDNKILVGGIYTSYSGVSRNGIIRLNTDGSIDNTFNIGSGFIAGGTGVGPVTMQIQPDGKIVAGGEFDFYDGVSRNKLARLNTNGSLDTTFDIGTGLSRTPLGGPRCNSLIIRDDNTIVAAGRFNIYNGNTRNLIVNINSNGEDEVCV